MSPEFRKAIFALVLNFLWPMAILPGQDQLQPAVTLTPDLQWENPELRARVPVFVYLANDLDVTYLHDNAYLNSMRFISLLREVESSELPAEEKQKVIRAAEQIQADLRLFNAAVDEEIRSLLRHTVENRAEIGLAVFRNQGMLHLARETIDPNTEWMKLQWHCYVPGTEGLRVEELELSGGREDERWKDLKQFQSQPLSLASFYRAALDGLGRVFPPDKYQYILFVKSRGHTADYLEPYLPMDSDALKPQDVWPIVTASKEDFREPSRSAVASLLQDCVAPFYLAQSPLYSSMNDRPFVSPYSFLREMTKRHHRAEGAFVPLYFPVVVMETGNGGLEKDAVIQDAIETSSERTLQALRIDNVGFFYTFDRLDRYHFFNFEKFFVHVGARDPYFPGEVKRLLDTMVQTQTDSTPSR